MRIQMTMTALDEDRWAYLQANVRAKYEIPEGVGRVCLAFSYGEEERHVEMPLALVPGLLGGLALGVRAMAALTPDALPDFLKNARETADPACKTTSEASRYTRDQDGSLRNPPGYPNDPGPWQE